MEHVHLSILLETIRKGRVLLLNKQQALAFTVICLTSLGMWNILSQALPMSVSPFCPPPIALLFTVVYLPALSLAVLFNDGHDHVMKNTPRKATLTLRSRDKARFYNYLIARVASVSIGLYASGYFTAASAFKGEHSFFHSLAAFHHVFRDKSSMQDAADIRSFCLVQDMMANTALLCLLGQSITLLVR
jgi:hypothetical protein